MLALISLSPFVVRIELDAVFFSWESKGTPPTIILPETNIAPENQWLEDEFPFGKAYFQVLLLLVSGRVRG